MKLMKNLAIPVLLVATVMIAGIFAFVPVEQANTVHQTSAGSNSLKIATSTSLGAILTINVDAAFPTVDIHNQVIDGYIIINTSVSNVDLTGTQLTNLKCATWTAGGVIAGAPEVVTSLDGEFRDGNRLTYHCHIPSDGSTVLVGLTADNGAVTIPAHAIITTTIDTVT